MLLYLFLLEGPGRMPRERVSESRGVLSKPENLPDLLLIELES
jgi:hypothetical protein